MNIRLALPHIGSTIPISAAKALKNFDTYCKIQCSSSRLAILVLLKLEYPNANYNLLSKQMILFIQELMFQESLHKRSSIDK